MRNAAAWHDKHGLPTTQSATRWTRRRHLGARLMERHIDALHLRSEEPCSGGVPRCLRPGRPRRGCRWPRADGPAQRRVDAVEASVDAAERAWAAPDAADEVYNPVGRGASVFANVPATIALERASVRVRGDAEASIAFASKLAELRGEWMLESAAQGGWPCRLAARQAAWAEDDSARSPGSGGRRVRSSLGLLLPWPDPARAGPPGRCTQTYRQVLEITATPGCPPLRRQPSPMLAWLSWPTSGVS